MWALTDRVTVYPRSGAPFEAWPAATAGELRPELETLLREGKVELYPYGEDGSALPLDEALAVVKRDDAWLPPAQSGRNGFEVVLTPPGDAEGSAITHASLRDPSTEADA